MLHATYLAWTIDFNVLFLLIKFAIGQKIEFIRDQKLTFFHHCAPNSRENVHIRDHQSFMATFAINGKTQLKITFLYDSQKWDLHIVW